MSRWLRTRLTSLFMRHRMEEEMDRELAFHLDMLTEQNMRAGLSPAEARALALREFGRVDGVKEGIRDSWLARAFETLSQDVRYGVRSLRGTPGFALVVVVTMALGIGANTAIFSLVNGVLFRPLPYADAGRLVILRQPALDQHTSRIAFSPPELDDYRQQVGAFAAVAEFHDMWFILLGDREPSRVATGVVSANYFDVLGVRPQLGRVFTAADEHSDAEAVLVLSHAYWQRAFDADPGIVGRLFEMNDRPHRVVGVLPPLPHYPADVDVYMPASACPFRSASAASGRRDARMGQALARLQPHATIEQAQADVDTVVGRMKSAHPDAYPGDVPFDPSVVPVRGELTRDFRTALLVLLGTAAFVLLIVCASIANLTLARTARRARELTVRSALGASRLRLLRQLLTESVILALAGGAAGLLTAYAGLDLLARLADRFTAGAADVRIDGTVLLFTLVISIATGVIFGAVPALTTRAVPAASLSTGGRATQRTHRLRNTLIVAQVAVSFMLLVGAGLTIRTLFELQQVDPGFSTDNIMTMRVDLNFTKYQDPKTDRAPFWEAVDRRLRAIPGVVGVGGAGTFPLNDLDPFANYVRIEGQPSEAARARVDVRLVSPGYFETLNQPLLDGRPFTADDRAGTDPVVIVNRTMAQHYWPGERAVGRRISGKDGGPWTTVVGVVADARQQLHEAPGDEVYLPVFQAGQLSTNWLVRSSLPPDEIIREARAAVRSIDAGQPVDQFRTLADVRMSSLASPRLTATLLALFALLALVITATGIAGVIAFSVSQRTQEFGVRMALGAGRVSVQRMVVTQGLKLALAGLAIGTGGALVLTRLLATLLFGVEPTDALTFLSVALVLLAVAVVACLIPARRAALVDPLVALRVG